jgi:hypothetical protein
MESKNIQNLAVFIFNSFIIIIRTIAKIYITHGPCTILIVTYNFFSRMQSNGSMTYNMFYKFFTQQYCVIKYDM